MTHKHSARVVAFSLEVSSSSRARVRYAITHLQPVVPIAPVSISAIWANAASEEHV